MYEHKVNLIHVLNIAHANDNYLCMKYIIDIISPIELHSVLTSGKFKRDSILSILLIDRIQKENDCYLKHLCHEEMMSIPRNILSDICNDDTVNLYETYIHIYYVIKYLSINEARKFITDKNILFKNTLVKFIKEDGYNDINEYVTIYNNLFEYHIRHRGAHTKSAQISS
jgi:hypothetical protein